MYTHGRFPVGWCCPVDASGRGLSAERADSCAGEARVNFKLFVCAPFHVDVGLVHRTYIYQRMHHALKIQEILLNILHHCPLSVRAALAKPCRAFKDPALDTLWQFLFSLAPLAQCLPEVSHQVSSWHKVRRFKVFVTVV